MHSLPVKTTHFLIPEFLVQFFVSCHPGVWPGNEFSGSVYPSFFCILRETLLSPWLLKAYGRGKLRKVQMN